MERFGVAVLTADLFGAITLTILLVGIFFESGRSRRKEQAYLILVVFALAAQYLDAATFLPLRWPEKLRFGLEVLCLCTPFVVWAVFLRYLFIYFSEKIPVSRLHFFIGAGLCAVGILSTVRYSISGHLLVMEDGKIGIGDYFQGYLWLYAVMGLYAACVILFNGKKLGARDTAAALMLVAIPLAATWISLAVPEMDLSTSAMALSIVIINTLLQAEYESNLVSDQAAAAKQARRDGMTDIQNRLAYDELCDSMEGDGFLGVVFADINALKYTNDHFGHTAGDRLICDFVEILRQTFRKDDLFRISGDEFVVLAVGITREAFDRKVQQLRQRAAERDPEPAAIGAAFGSQAQVATLLAMAEEEMYQRKKEFYKQHPTYTRSTL